jgi:hypothetical protein
MGLHTCPNCGVVLTGRELRVRRCDRCRHRLFPSTAPPPARPTVRPAATGEESGPLANPFVLARRILWGIVIGVDVVIGGGLAVLGAVLHDSTLPVVGLWVGAAVTMVFAAVILFLGPTVRRVEEELAAFRRGECLAHWMYTEDEWRNFAEFKWQDAREWGYAAPVAVAILIALVLGLPLWGAYFEASAVAALPCFGLCTVAGALAGLGIGRLIRLLAWRRYQRRLRAVGEAYLGEGGIYFEGTYSRWGSWGTRFSGARIREGDPPMVVVTLTSGAGSRQYTNDVQVPIPAGRDGEAERIVARWQGRHS